MAHPKGLGRMVVSNVVKKITDAMTAGANIPGNGVFSVFIQNRDPANSCLWTDTGVDPTATEAGILEPGDILVYDGDPYALRFLRAGAADVTSLVIFYYGAS